MPSRDRLARTCASLAVAPALLFTLTGCPAAHSGPGPGGSSLTTTPAANEPTQNEQLAAALATEIESFPDVEDASAKWQDRFEAPENLSLTVGITAGADIDPVVEEIVRLAWVSDIQPLSTVSIYASDVNDVNRRQDQNVLFDDANTAQELEREYGARPG